MIYLPFDGLSRAYSIERKIIEEVILAAFVIAIFAFAYRKRIFKAFIWKIFIFVLIADNIYGFIEAINTQPHDLVFWLALIITSVLCIVNVIAVYLYSFKFFSESKTNPRVLK